MNIFSARNGKIEVRNLRHKIFHYDKHFMQELKFSKINCLFKRANPVLFLFIFGLFKHTFYKKL